MCIIKINYTKLVMLVNYYNWLVRSLFEQDELVSIRVCLFHPLQYSVNRSRYFVYFDSCMKTFSARVMANHKTGC